jgi:hypothetical protein
MREEADKESEVTMIGSIHSNTGTETARAAAVAKAGKSVESFDQYLDNAALPEDDQAGEEAIQEQAPSTNESIASEADESAPPEEETSAESIPESGRPSPLLGRRALVIFPLGDAASIGPASDEYFALLKQCHDEVVAERNIDIGKYEAYPALKDTSEGRAATQAIYEKLAAIPRAQELKQILGLTAVTDVGEPYNPNIQKNMAMRMENWEARIQGGLNPVLEDGRQWSFKLGQYVKAEAPESHVYSRKNS